MVFKFPYKLIIRDSGQLEFRKKKTFSHMSLYNFVGLFVKVREGIKQMFG